MAEQRSAEHVEEQVSPLLNVDPVTTVRCDMENLTIIAGSKEAVDVDSNCTKVESSDSDDSGSTTAVEEDSRTTVTESQDCDGKSVSSLLINATTLQSSDNTEQFDCPKTPESSTGSSTPACSSPSTLRDDIPSLGVIEGYSSSASASSTPRDESSSGSPSPILDDVSGTSVVKEKPRVKLGKDLSLMMQALNSLQSPEEKIAALCKKYSDALEQQKLLQKQLRLSQRKQVQAAKEKEQLHAENTKAIMARSKLESLCRELQKRNKAIKEEQNQKSLEEVSLRQEMAAEFQTTLNRIQSQMKTAVDGSTKLQSENERIGGKLNEIVEKYQARETAMENLVKQHSLQEQIITAQLKKAVLEHQEDKEQFAQEKEKLLGQILEKTLMYESKVKLEKELRVQLQYYSEKFEDFQSTLEKSNEIFTSFRSEMDKMSKKLKQAEKYRATIQKKWEDSTKALADTVDYTQQLEAKQARLEKLSRALQVERNELAQRLRQYEDKNKKPKDGAKRKKGREDQTKKEMANIDKENSKILIENQTTLNCDVKTSPKQSGLLEETTTESDEVTEKAEDNKTNTSPNTPELSDQPGESMGVVTSDTLIPSAETSGGSSVSSKEVAEQSDPAETSS